MNKVTFRRFYRKKVQSQKSKKEVPYSIQYGNSLAGIASLILAIYLMGQSQTIKDMDRLLNKQDTVITNLSAIMEGQNEQIKTLIAQVDQLKSIDSTAIVTSEKISDQVSATKDQTVYIQQSQAPKLLLTGLLVDSLTTPKGQYNYLLKLKNNGVRDATDLKVYTTFFKEDNGSLFVSTPFLRQ